MRSKLEVAKKIANVTNLEPDVPGAGWAGTLCQKYPYKARKNVWKKPLDTMIITIFQCKLAKKIKKILADFKDLPGWKNDIPSNVSNQKNNAS